MISKARNSQMNHSFLVSIFSQILLDILVINFTYVYWIDSESTHCVKRVQIRSFFWSVFSRIRTEYGEIRSASKYSGQVNKTKT